MKDGPYIYGETRDTVGNVISFTCHPDTVEEVKMFISEKVRSINLPVTHTTNVSHGTYGRYSRYNICQHKYGGGGPGYIEAIEILNAPDGHHPLVIHEYNVYTGSVFIEFEDLETLLSGYKDVWAIKLDKEKVKALRGFRRFVACGFVTPWFYAIGDEELIGDYALPYGMEDDPLYRLGRKFLVKKTSDNIAHVRTCLGCRIIEEDAYVSAYSGTKKIKKRYIHFDDGAVAKMDMDGRYVGDVESIIPIEDSGTALISDSIQKLLGVLSGASKGAKIKLDTGQLLSINLSAKGKKVPSVEGDYLLKVTTDSQEQEGWVLGFKPTDKFPDIVTLVKEKMEGEVQKVEIEKFSAKKGGKKWCGAFRTIHIAPRNQTV